MTPLAARLANPEGLEMAPEEDTTSAATVSTASTPARAAKKRRVVGLTGGVMLSQNGVVVRYRKKCLRCGYVDTSVTSMQIKPGVTRVRFNCPKCSKSQEIVIHCVG
jgi:ribosomal protein S27AE